VFRNVGIQNSDAEDLPRREKKTNTKWTNLFYIKHFIKKIHNTCNLAQRSPAHH
jgi:hypothetical protein